MSAAEKRPPGRPRDTATDAAIATATLELLAEVGFANLTIEAVAVRAGVGKPSIYRRWPTKLELVVAAVEQAAPPLEPKRSDDPRRDLEQLIETLVRDMTASPIAYALLAVAADPQGHPELIDRLADSYIAPRQAAAVTLIQHAIDSGALAASVDPDLLVEELIGPAVFRWLRTGRPIPESRMHDYFESTWHAHATTPGATRADPGASSSR
jgi:AcrR family transcriptional regulator